jgi:hypothetical protein
MQRRFAPQPTPCSSTSITELNCFPPLNIFTSLLRLMRHRRSSLSNNPNTSHRFSFSVDDYYHFMKSTFAIQSNLTSHCELVLDEMTPFSQRDVAQTPTACGYTRFIVLSSTAWHPD